MHSACWERKKMHRHSTVPKTPKTDPETGTGSGKKAQGPREIGMAFLFALSWHY